MRNLQKILALVLALVMSLSLMATAGARDFTDGDQIDETFAESVDVLTGLEVFQGYPSGDFQPKGDITRAEVAAIIYRIATGDVTDSQVGIYADYNKFSDVPSDNWAAGYINYCANAEYIKGRGDGKFYPQDKVTGYEALAMILRVVGYDKNGEFTGADWQVQTAATANQRKVTKNVNAGTLGTPATRETVAELLCQAILIEKVNYTLAFGYQISTDPEDTIAYETFKMEKLEGVVTGNEIADLKTDKGTALGANQTRLVIDGREEVMNIPTGLDDIGECVRVYIRPENGTVRNDLVTSKVYSEGLNKVFTTSERVGSVGNTTGSSEGITSIEGAEHFINFDQADKYEARIRIKYVMQVRMSEYDARLMYRQNGSESNSRLIGIGDATYTAYNTATAADGTKYVPCLDVPNPNTWDTLIRSASGYTFQYEKTIDAFSDLTAQDYSNIKSIFTNGDNTDTWLKGEVYVGTSSKQNQDDVSDDIRWEDFVATYLKAEENKEQVESNGQGCWLKIIDNDNDGIAEYVLQTRYTVAKVAANGTGLDIATLKLTDNNAYNDSCNEVSASDKITVVSGTNLEASEDTVAAGDVVIYAKIDGVIRAQKAESETSRVTTINRSTNPVTATIESGEKKESWVHTHSNGLKSYLTNMVIGTNYTVYFDLYGNIAAYTEGDVGQFTLITDGWFNQTATAREYAVQAYVDGKLQTVNITNNGQLFIQDGGNNNRWGMLKTNFGGNTNATSLNNDGQNMNTIVATLENGNLVPVDKSYRYSQQVVMLDMNENKIPTRDNNATGHVWTTDYVNGTAYKKDSDNSNVQRTSALVLGRSDTVYYYVYKTGTNTVTGAPDYVVRTYTGYNNIPSINPIYIEDVYAVGVETRANNGTVNPTVNYTAEVVVVELNGDYKYVNNSEQVFIPGLTVVNNSVSRTAGYGVETITMIRENGEVADVKVDMSQSTVKYYDIAEGGNRLYAGLYYMSPITTGSDIYRIEPMDAAAIRANNYLAGYVDQANGVLPTDYVRVNLQTTVGLDTDNFYATGRPIDDSRGTIGKTVNTENLYTLGYSGNVANLTKAPASTVFNQYPDQGVSDTRSDYLNELFGANNTIGRNEVLVRYSGGSVVWAISFREFADGGNNNPSRDAAQTVWQKCLPSATATSGVKFYGVGDNLAGDTNAAVRTITVPYAAVVNGAKILDFSAAYAATISTYTLTKWTGTDFAQTISRADEARETAEFNKGGAQYKLVVNFVSGGFETYYLNLEGAAGTGKLQQAEGVANNTVIDATTGALKIPALPVYIPAYVNSFAVDQADATVEWTFTLTNVPGVNPETFTVNSRMVDGVLKIDANDLAKIPAGTTTSEIATVTARVIAQNGTVTDIRGFQASGVTPVRVNYRKEVTVTYNGTTYNADGAKAGTVKAVPGSRVTVSAATYGVFTKADGTYLGETDADHPTLEVVVPNGNMSIVFVSADNAGLIGAIDENGKLIRDVVLKDKETISSDTTIDLNGKTISLNNDDPDATKGVFVINNGTLTLKNGTIKTTGKTRAISVQGENANVVLENMTIDGGVGSPIVVTSGATNSRITITGGSITGHGVAAIQVNGTKGNGGILNINGAKISSVESTWGPAIYLAGPISTTVSGASEISGPTAIEIRNGGLTVNGGTITSTNAAQVSATANGNGPSVGSGAALVVSPHQVANLTLTVNLFGGSFNGTQGVKLVDVNNQTDETGTVTIVPSITNISNEGAWRLDNGTGNAVYTKVPAGS